MGYFKKPPKEMVMNTLRATKILISLLLALNLICCVSAPPLDREGRVKKFVSIAETSPDRLWSPNLSETTHKAISDYQVGKKLSSGKIYGESVRAYDLRNKCASDIDRELKQLGCGKKTDVLKNPHTKSPLLTSSGQTIPMVVFLCPDGGVVRLKPQGDPTSKFKPQPLASKALRYPFDSKFENFDDERVKIDNFGNAIPKWPKDLNPELASSKDQPQIIEGWADDAHTDLKLDCPKGL